MGKGGRDKKSKPGELLVCRNAKATQRYEIGERLEAGLVLVGSEVKSLRDKRGDLEGAFASIDRDELYLHRMNISPYAQATVFGHEPKRTRKLLVHRQEIERLRGKLALKGMTLVPLRVYFKEGRAKVELGLGRGKREGDDRESIRRELDLREARNAVRARRR